MDLFVEHINKIRPIAKKIADYNGDRFDVDELVNEAYMGYHRAITNNPEVFSTGWQRVLSRAKFDMFDYVRKTLGLRHVNHIDFVHMSYQRDDDDERTFFEPQCQDSNFEAFEGDDFLDGLLKKVKLTNQEWTIIQSYFYEENTLKKVGTEIGLSEARTSQKKTHMLERLNEAAEEMLV